MSSQLLKVEYGRDSLRLTDDPLGFIAQDIVRIVDTMPDDLRMDVLTATNITVVITTE